MKPGVLVTVRPDLRRKIFDEAALSALESFAEVTYHAGEADMTGEELKRAIGDFEGLITCWGSPAVTEDVLREARRLRIISHAAGSIRPYVCPEALEKGIVLTNASSAIAISVAETTLGMIICSLRGLCLHDRRLREGQGRIPGWRAYELSGKTVGIIGMGEVGRRVMKLLRPFGCRILVFDPFKKEGEIAEAGGSPSSLKRLIEESDIVSLHAPDIPENRHMISADLIASMRQGCLFVNTARGRLVDEEALLAHVKSGRIRVALDVFEGAPLEVAGDLGDASNALLTPHIAGLAVESRKRQGRTVVEDLRLFFAEKDPGIW